MIWKSLLPACVCGPSLRFSKNTGPFCKKALADFFNLLVSANTCYLKKKKKIMDQSLVITMMKEIFFLTIKVARSQNINQTPVQAG